MSRVFIGVDWGTHSSKLWIAHDRKVLDAPIFSSDMLCVDGTLTFSHQPQTDDDGPLRGLKSFLINDSLATPFWSREDRLDTGTSLGEAVTFSVVCLLAEAKRIVEKRTDASFNESELGFSFPNWLAEDSKKASTAAKNFCEAAQAAMEIVVTLAGPDLPKPGKAFQVAQWKRIVEAARKSLSGVQMDHLTIQTASQAEFSIRGSGPRWRFIVESGAAGIPYLRFMRVPKAKGTLGLAKLLIVDVGAGSTDVGYMLKTSAWQTGNATFYHLRPASTFAVAGNQLTDGLRKHFRAQNKPIGYREAEAQKTSDTEWSKLPFVKVWIDQICDHVETYIHGVPDERWLPLEKDLNIVVTGGSGLVPGLKDALSHSVKAALRGRKFDRRTCEAVKTVDRYEPRFDFRTEADIARRAVSFGAADPDKPGFRYIESFGPPSIHPTVTAAPRWT